MERTTAGLRGVMNPEKCNWHEINFRWNKKWDWIYDNVGKVTIVMKTKKGEDDEV